ncbi:MAG TPA: hypothetical protein VKZ75_02890 [Cyclobacteriaceae bacterium]|nr:hypothetical protein [Cyclobacteriaceae bacterium]
MSGAALFRFALLLVKKGTLLGPVVDYDRQRKDSLKDVPREIFDPESFIQSHFKTLGYYSEFHELRRIIDSESHGINPGDHS